MFCIAKAEGGTQLSSFSQSIISLFICVLYGNLRARESHRLESVIKAASKTIGLNILDLHRIFESAITYKIQANMPDHTIHFIIQWLPTNQEQFVLPASPH